MEIPPDELAAVDFDFKKLEESEPRELKVDEGSLEAANRDLFGPHEEQHFDLGDPDLEEYEPSEGLNEESEHAIRRVKAAEYLWDDDEEAEAQQKEENDLEGNREIPIAPMEATSPTVPSTVGESSA